MRERCEHAGARGYCPHTATGSTNSDRKRPLRMLTPVRRLNASLSLPPTSDVRFNPLNAFNAADNDATYRAGQRVYTTYFTHLKNFQSSRIKIMLTNFFLKRDPVNSRTDPQPLVGPSLPYCEDIWKTYCCLIIFSGCRYVP